MHVSSALQAISIQPVIIALYVPDAAAIRKAYEHGSIPFPYWSQVWPAAKALAQFLVDNPVYTQGKYVVELGAGLGLPSLVAAGNAANVLCTDYVPEAVRLAAQSAAQAGLQNFSAQVLDWQHLPTELEADVLLLSDINYEPAAFAILLQIVKTFLEKGTQVLLSTPQRLMAKDFIAPLISLCSYQEEITVAHEGKNVSTTVMVLEKK